jgi:FixJ family two-component response regulator
MSDPAAVPVAIIDDDELQCRSLSRLVRRAGFDALIFRSAEDFLASPGRAVPRCLLLDIHLGGMSGFALHHELLARGDLTPVIYITAHDNEATRIAALKTGCAAFLLKTDASSTIIETLRRVTSVA